MNRDKMTEEELYNIVKHYFEKRNVKTICHIIGQVNM